MSLFKVGIIGCGGRGKGHTAGYAASQDAEIIACCDPVKENAEAVAKQYNIPRIYEDYKEMLKTEKPDIVSVCVWTGLHLPIVVAAARSGVKGIHCEKPMAVTWGDAKKMYQVCVDNNVMITFCHQRRFGASFIKAKQLANSGIIGQLHRLEGYCPNMFDWGTHWFDMFFFYNNDEPAEWVIGQINCEQEGTAFAVPIENHGTSYVKWKNGVYGMLITGGDMGGRCANRLIGSDGIIEVGVHNGPSIRYLAKGVGTWIVPDLGPWRRGDDTVLSVLDLIDCLKTGREPELSGRKALQATELIFATYESSRRRAKIYLPLDIKDSPLISMINRRMVGSKRKKRSAM